VPTIEVTDRWTGTGRADQEIISPPPHEDGWHPSALRGMFEHWYFDARLDDGHTIVGFLQTAELLTKKPGVELHVYKPDGTRIEIRRRYPAAAARASTEGCQVQVGANRVTTDYPAGGLPVHNLLLDEDGVRFDLQFAAEVPAWKPGEGRTDYGTRDYFAWVVGAPRARVSGTIAYEGSEFEVGGIGYHDHNWGVGNMGRIVDHWYWGRVYADEFTLVYADVTAREKYGSHASTPVMLAFEDRIVLSTGEVTVETGPEVFNAVANHAYPSHLTLRSGADMVLRLDVREIIHAHDLLDDFPVVRSRWVKPIVNRVAGRPGYFRFRSDFTLTAMLDGEPHVRHGSTLHEMVALR
jgi:hypothetical protein